MASTGPVALRLEGAFDVRAARAVAQVVERARPGARVDLDFSQVRQFDDFGIAVLAQAIKAARRVAVQVTGLRQHQLKLMRYFGFDPASVAATRVP